MTRMLAAAFALMMAPVALSAPPAAAQLAPPAPSAVGLDFARAYMDRDIYAAALRAAFQREIATCVTAGKLTPDEAAAKRVSYGAYVDVWATYFPDVQYKVAAAMRDTFDTSELTILNTFYRSPVGQRLTELAATSVAAIAATRFRICALPEAPPADRDKLVQQLIAKLTPAELSEVARFGATPSSKKLHDFLPAIGAIVRPAFQTAANEAAAKVGLLGDAI